MAKLERAKKKKNEKKHISKPAETPRKRESDSFPEFQDVKKVDYMAFVAT